MAGTNNKFLIHNIIMIQHWVSPMTSNHDNTLLFTHHIMMSNHSNIPLTPSPGTISQETADSISISPSTLEHLPHSHNSRHSETLTRKERDEKPSHLRERRALRSSNIWPNATIPFTFDTGSLCKSHACSRCGNFHFSATKWLLWNIVTLRLLTSVSYCTKTVYNTMLLLWGLSGYDVMV